MIVNATHTNVDIAVSAAEALKYMHKQYFDCENVEMNAIIDI